MANNTDEKKDCMSSFLNAYYEDTDREEIYNKEILEKFSKIREAFKDQPTHRLKLPYEE